MKKKAIIVSEYSIPICKGQLEYTINAKALYCVLFVIANNDYQRGFKGSEKFQDEDKRMIIMSNIMIANKAFFSIDQDRTVCETIRIIAKEYGAEYVLVFAKGGDQNNSTIPERTVCENMNIAQIDRIGDKAQSFSWLLR